MIIDTHAHIDGEEFREDFEAMLQRAKDAGLGLMVNPATDLENSKEVLKLATSLPHVYACIGFHPKYASLYTAEARDEIFELSKHEKVVAIGEIGLDYHYDDCDKEKQKRAFREQIEMARELKLPIVIHTRDADKETFDILAEEKAFELGVLMHCYSQSYEMAKEYVKRGATLGIGGVVTFKNAKKLVEVVTNIPLEHLVLETDCPYLAPEPFRGKRNEPSYVARVCQKIADLKGLTYEEVAEQTTKNALDFFRIKL